MPERFVPQPERPSARREQPNAIERLAQRIDQKTAELREENRRREQNPPGAVATWAEAMMMALEGRNFLRSQGAQVDAALKETIGDLIENPGDLDMVALLGGARFLKIGTDYDSEREKKRIGLQDKLVREFGRLHVAAEKRQQLETIRGHLDEIAQDRMHRSGSESSVTGKAREFNEHYVPMETTDRDTATREITDFLNQLLTPRR